MAKRAEIEVNPENAWRTEAPPVHGWERGVRAQDEKKYFMVSIDSHLGPPPTLFKERIDKRFVDRLPHVVVRDGKKYMIQEGCRPEQVYEPEMRGEDLVRSRAGASLHTQFVDGIPQPNQSMLDRLEDQRNDGVDGEVVFPNGPGLLVFGSTDAEFAMAQCRIWNDWAMETCKPYHNFSKPVAAVPTADVDAAIEEVKRVAKLGYASIMLPSKPIWGAHDVAHANYNLPMYDPLWEVIQDHDLPIVFHISGGRDPRLSRGNGGAIVNYIIHSILPTLEPMVNLCASGVFEKYPRLQAGTIEAGGGWIPWTLQLMDESHIKHHFWVRPRLPKLPSDYFRSNCFASVAEDRVALELAESNNLTDNLMWANDYPHHEGSWPHSAQAIERNFGDLVSEQGRKKILGLNAARIFKFDVPENLR